MAVRPPLITWASRGAGAIGLVTATLYLGLIIGQDNASDVPAAILYFVLMAAAGLAAWFADRVSTPTGRRMVWFAFGVFFMIGVLSVLTVGILFLLAAVLSVFSLSRSRPGQPGNAITKDADDL
ncbi:MAG: hypothetical protein DWQ40_01560 [Actinobacteria bacterium]|nr:MAG: hypothetical protein DWQ40_01560 [Actinomycetota bacterium]